MTKLSTRIVAIIAGMAFILSSCGGGDKPSDASNEFDEGEQALEDNITTVVYEIPPPSEIPGMLERSGVEYNFELLNPETNVDSYMINSDKAAMNLGVYATDVGYLIAYEKVQEALDYMGTSRKLAEELGLTGSFESSVVAQFERNLDNRDSLVYLLDNTIENSSEYLNNEQRQKTAALMLTGSVVEGLHISCQLVKNYPSDLPDNIKNMVLTDLIRAILEQEKSVGEVVKMLETIEQTGDISSILTQFKSLKAQYESLDIQEQISNNQGSLVLTDEHLTEITAILEDLRADITM